jgi:hypothetical protein
LASCRYAPVLNKYHQRGQGFEHYLLLHALFSHLPTVRPFTDSPLHITLDITVGIATIRIMRQCQAPYPPLLISLLILPIATPFATSVCYYPNGHSETSPDYQPCAFYNGETRMCCATNRTNPFGGDASDGLTADRCLENGLCLSNFEDVDGRIRTEYWRDQCTSLDWISGGCLNACIDGTVSYG